MIGTMSFSSLEVPAVKGERQGWNKHTALCRYPLEKVLRYLFIFSRQRLYESYAIIRRRLFDIKPLEAQRHPGHWRRTTAAALLEQGSIEESKEVKKLEAQQQH